jgi:hypothetical protein
MTDEPERKGREPAWIGRLSRVGTMAQRMRGRPPGSVGPASEGRLLTAWSCSCGWSGEARELGLERRTAALACPSCGEAGGLNAGPGP